MKVLVYGGNGHMGRIVRRLIEESSDMSVVASVDVMGGEDCLTDANAFEGEADCIIDFSHHSLTKPLLDFATARKLPLVLCTTGQTAEEKAMIAEAGKVIPIFFSATMSPAIAMLADMAAKAAAMFPDADIEIVESHHNRKVDVPSGTALIFAHAIENAVENSTILVGRHENGRRKPREIAVHSLRIGNECGTHEVIIATNTQIITLKHEARDRALFAEGALKAAAFITKQQPGIYAMQALVDAEQEA